MATFVIVHGAWSGGWSWIKVRRLLEAQGHEVFTPTLTGLGERAHLAGPDVDLETHVRDVLGVLEFEGLRDVVLVGHSYGGMVVTGVADRAAERLRCVIYLDAMVPKDGQALLDLVAPADREQRLAAAAASEGGWRLPPNPPAADVSEADLAWTTPRRLPQPLRTFAQPLRLEADLGNLPRHYIYCLKSGPGDVFRQFYDRAGSEPGWTRHTIDTSHAPNITAPEVITPLLLQLAA